MLMPPDEKKDVIKKFLLSYKCQKNLSGFGILVKAIDIATENPDFAEEINCEDIFRECAAIMYPGESTNSFWKANYRAARYCIQKSSYKPTDNGRYSIPEFIQDGRDYVINAAKSRQGRGA